MIRKVQFEEIPEAERGELLHVYNTSNLERLRVDPPLNDSLVQKVVAIKWIGWKDIPQPVDYACVSKVSPTEILIEVGHWPCGKDLVKKILEVLRQESEVEAILPKALL